MCVTTKIVIHTHLSSATVKLNPKMKSHKYMNIRCIVNECMLNQYFEENLFRMYVENKLSTYETNKLFFNPKQAVCEMQRVLMFLSVVCSHLTHFLWCGPYTRLFEETIGVSFTEFVISMWSLCPFNIIAVKFDMVKGALHTLIVLFHCMHSIRLHDFLFKILLKNRRISKFKFKIFFFFWEARNVYNVQQALISHSKKSCPSIN